MGHATGFSQGQAFPIVLQFEAIVSGAPAARHLRIRAKRDQLPVIGKNVHAHLRQISNICHSDIGRQAALLKKPLKHSKSVFFAGGRKSLTGEEKTARVIGDGQGGAVLMIPQQELTLVIGAPQLIRFLA